MSPAQTSLFEYAGGAPPPCPRGAFGDFYNCPGRFQLGCRERTLCQKRSVPPPGREFTVTTSRGNEVRVKVRPRFVTDSDLFEFRGETVSQTGYCAHPTEGYIDPQQFEEYARRVADELENRYFSLPACKKCRSRTDYLDKKGVCFWCNMPKCEVCGRPTYDRGKKICVRCEEKMGKEGEKPPSRSI